MQFVDFQESSPGPRQEQTEFGEFQYFTMAAGENTEKCKFIDRRSVWRAPGANFEYFPAAVGAKSVFAIKRPPEKVFDMIRG